MQKKNWTQLTDEKRAARTNCIAILPILPWPIYNEEGGKLRPVIYSSTTPNPAAEYYCHSLNIQEVVMYQQ